MTYGQQIALALDLNPLDYNIWRVVQQRVYQSLN
jgi:hypothetical protein